MKTVLTAVFMIVVTGLLMSSGVQAQQVLSAPGVAQTPTVMQVPAQLQSGEMFRLRMQMDVERVSAGGQTVPTGQQVVYTSPPGDGDKVMALWYAELQQLAGCGVGSPDADPGKAAIIAEELGNLWTQ